MKKLFLSLALGTLLFAALPQFANAECTPVYGGGETCVTYSFTINKLVQKPGKGGGDFVDNLSLNDPRYSPEQNVNFKIVVHNTGTNTISSLNIVDTLPNYTSFVSGPGTYNSSNNTLTFNVYNLGAGQSAAYTVVVKVANAKTLPNSNSVMCLLNQVTGTDNNGVQNSDQSQFCVEHGVPVLPAPKVTKTPPTGPEMLPLLALLPGGLGGYLLRKRSKNSIFKGGEK